MKLWLNMRLMLQLAANYVIIDHKSTYYRQNQHYHYKSSSLMQSNIIKKLTCQSLQTILR